MKYEYENKNDKFIFRNFLMTFIKFKFNINILHYYVPDRPVENTFKLVDYTHSSPLPTLMP